MGAGGTSHARLMLRLLVCGCCAALAAGLRAASATVRYRASEESFHSGEPLYDSVLRFGAAAAGLALAVQLALDWAPAVDPLLKVEAAELAAPTVTEGAELLTLREDGGVTKAVPLYPKVPNRLSGAPLPQFTMAEVAEHGKAAGLDYVFWEPMSVAREFGETIAECMALQDRLTAANMAIPMWMMADIDHGDVTSDNPDDFDPYAWARAVPKVSPIIHIKQSLMDKGGHRPFTAEFNARGRIQPEPLLAAFAEGGATDNEICLELSFKEREPNDREVIPQIAESVAFWAPHIDTGAASLNI